jgi:DNA-binding transcriptional ArsR family regulator
MVNYRNDALDRVFSALADPTRRALVARLGQSESLTVSELARPFPVSLPAIMKHLDVLSDAGLIARNKTGRTVSCQLTAATMKSAMDWLHRYERFWSEGLNRLDALLKEDESCPPKQPPSQALSSQASPSSAASTRRRRKSTPPGPTRR